MCKPLFITILLVLFLLAPVMQLLQHLMKLPRNRKPQIRCILHKAQAFVGDVEENDRGSEHTCFTENVRIQQVSDTYQRKDQNFPALCELYIYANYLNLNILISCNLR